MGADVAEQRRVAVNDDQVSYAQFRALANSIPNLAWMANPDGWIFWYNQRWYEYTGTTPEEMVGWGWQSVHHPDILPEMLDRWTTALESGNPFEMTFPLRRGSDGSYRTFMTRAEPLREGGEIVGWFGTNTDITDQERTRERLQLVINELNHRVKNTLGTVQSIAFNTFRDAPGELNETFEDRLRALSSFHDLLAREGWARTSLLDVVRLTTSMFDADRFELQGEDLPIEPRLASSLSMTLHELCTNALKYGAFASAGGRVIIAWRTERAGARSFLILDWLETGGPPVSAPEKTGFGLRLIKRAASGDSGASVHHEFAPEGVRCTIRVPLDPGFLR